MDRCFVAYAAVFAAVLLPAEAIAATVSVDVRGSDGKPLAGAVIALDTPRKPAGPIKFDPPYEMAQQNIAFVPHVLIVPVGATVTFPNRDKVRHHVYSFSKPRKFDLKLYGKDETRSVVFDKPGVVALGCNIHDAMNGYVVVVETPYAVQTDANGHATITGVPAGGATIRVWHPSIRAPDNMLVQSATIAPTGFATTYTIRGR
ncbi:methylamine utilization protein [Sphingomonas glacialis]|uniref:Methylamine utilization protein n=1 Tax=Sphingomonas glacialis TaxID=658225 RepID=A0A502FX66_9SPHN|nr:methylamine utilization protein [Sphingomonas glacialis]TPG54108.1 methylamine utilization protein [Sphingomonas glacialis]